MKQNNNNDDKNNKPFFKKKCIENNSKENKENINVNNKQKKIFLLKVTNNNNKNNQNKINNQDKTLNNNKPNSPQLPSTQLIAPNFLNPLKNQPSSFPALSSFCLQISTFIQPFLSHKTHQHIWGGYECFFTQKQFYQICNKILSQKSIIKFNQINNQQKINKIIHNLWYDLAGDKYGGVVKQNMLKFIDIVFGITQYNDKQDIMIIQQQNKISNFSISSQIQSLPYSQQQQQSIKLPSSNRHYINDSTLKLINLTNKQKYKIHKYYLSILISKQSQNILQNVLQNLQSSCLVSNNQKIQQNEQIQQNGLNTQNTQQNQLINNAYLQSDYYRYNKLTSSPIITPKSQNKYIDNNDNDFQNLRNFDDFSPKLTSQQHQPFRSMILQRNNTKITEQSHTINGNITAPFQPQHFNPHLKPLLSVDVNLGQGLTDKLIVYQGQTPYEVSLQLKIKYNIDQDLRLRFQKMLQSHMRNLLFKIQEVSEDLCQDDEIVKDLK